MQSAIRRQLEIGNMTMRVPAILPPIRMTHKPQVHDLNAFLAARTLQLPCARAVGLPDGEMLSLKNDTVRQRLNSDMTEH